MNAKELFYILGDLSAYSVSQVEAAPYRVVTKDGRTVTGVQVDHDAKELILVTRNPKAEAIAKSFHETYERLAPYYNYRTRAESAVPWDDVPEANKTLMLEVVSELIDQGVIYGRGTTSSPGRSGQEPS